MLQDIGGAQPGRFSRDASDDIHHQATLLRAWEQEYAQLQPGRFRGSVNFLRNGCVRLFSEQMNRATFQVGSLPEGRLAFGLPTRAAGASVICGEEGNRDSLFVFSGRTGFEFRSPAEFEFLGIEMSCDDDGDPVYGAMARRLAGILGSTRRAIPLDAHRARKLGRLLQTMLDEDPICELLSFDSQAVAFNRGLIGWILDLLPDPASRPGRPGQRHWDTVAKIRRLVAESPLCPVSVAELMVEIGVSRRTLQTACHETVGLTPVQYLRTLRLGEARRALGQARSVTEAATQFGFWHLGYFARDYKAMFGELPSETLQGHRRRLA